MEKSTPLIQPGMEFKERYKKSETTHFDIHFKSPTITTNDELHLGASRAHAHRPFQYVVFSTSKSPLSGSSALDGPTSTSYTPASLAHASRPSW